MVYVVANHYGQFLFVIKIPLVYKTSDDDENLSEKIRIV
jgi:hypothetical protein